MPIEIRELHIKVFVQDHAQKEDATIPATTPNQVDAIVAECVEQVVKIIKEKKER